MSIEKSLKTKAARTEAILEENELARDDDRVLITAYWERFHGIDPNGPVARFLLNNKIAMPDTITRARREIQNKGKFLGKRRVARMELENEHREFYRE
ncbi:MAG: hypothetical protein ACXABY_27960 [Candidatus Thorarchaeota archaeon]|jgi:hypothetical protein